LKSGEIEPDLNTKDTKKPSHLAAALLFSRSSLRIATGSFPPALLQILAGARCTRGLQVMARSLEFTDGDTEGALIAVSNVAFSRLEQQVEEIGVYPSLL